MTTRARASRSPALASALRSTRRAALALLGAPETMTAARAQRLADRLARAAGRLACEAWWVRHSPR